MIITITLTLAFLVALNFLLLIFSCNKPTKYNPKQKQTIQKPAIIKATKPIVQTKQLATNVLAPTGS